MSDIADNYFRLANGDRLMAARLCARDLMRGDSTQFKAGYTAENAALAVKDLFGLSTEAVAQLESLLLAQETTNTNSERAEKAYRAVLHYEDDSNIEECISDLLGDLRHLCDESGYDYAERDRIGYRNYLDELGEDRASKPLYSARL
jgi:hypothetical protein